MSSLGHDLDVSSLDCGESLRYLAFESWLSKHERDHIVLAVVVWSHVLRQFVELVVARVKDLLRNVSKVAVASKVLPVVLHVKALHYEF